MYEQYFTEQFKKIKPAKYNEITYISYIEIKKNDKNENSYHFKIIDINTNLDEYFKEYTFVKLSLAYLPFFIKNV